MSSRLEEKLHFALIFITGELINSYVLKGFLYSKMQNSEVILSKTNRRQQVGFCIFLFICYNSLIDILYTTCKFCDMNKSHLLWSFCPFFDD